MKTYTKSLLICLLTGITISTAATPFTAIKQAVKNHPIATIGSLCLAGCVALGAPAVYYQETHKEVSKHKKLGADIQQHSEAYKIIPDKFIQKIDTTPLYSDQEKQEIKQCIGNYNAKLRRYKSNKASPRNHTDKVTNEVCKDPLREEKSNLRILLRNNLKQSPEVTRFQNARLREQCAVGLFAATLLGMAIAWNEDYKEQHPWIKERYWRNS